MKPARDRATVAVVALLLLAGGAAYWQSWADRDQLATSLDEAHAQQDELASAVGTLVGQVEGLRP